MPVGPTRPRTNDRLDRFVASQIGPEAIGPAGFKLRSGPHLEMEGDFFFLAGGRKSIQINQGTLLKASFPGVHSGDSASPASVGGGDRRMA